jgi:hypothetical protein
MIRFRGMLGLAVAALLLPACGSSHGGGAVVNGPGVLEFLTAAVQVDEEDPTGTVLLTVTRTGGSRGAVSADWAAVAGTADGADFTVASSIITWADGEADPKTFTVNITADIVAEGSESFTVNLSNATGGALLGAAATATVEILDTLDAPVSGILQFSVANYPTAEGVSRIVNVTRTAGSTDSVSVEVALGVGSTAGAADYTDPGFAVLLTWAAGNSAPQAVVIPIVDDLPGALDAPVETIQLVLQNQMNLTTPGTPPALGTINTASVDITDGDTAGEITFVSSAYAIQENATTIDLVVRRENGTQGAASVLVSLAGGTAVSGTDFTFTSPFLVEWLDGEGGDKPVTIGILNDGDVLGNLTADFSLGTFVGAASGSQTTTQLTIEDDDVLPTAGTIRFTAASYAVNESAVTLTITLIRQGGTLGQVDVTVATLDGTAISAPSPANKQDYVALNQPVTWLDGEGGTKNVVITIRNNDGNATATGDVFQGTETFTVNFSITSPAGTPDPLGTNPVTVTITDD